LGSDSALGALILVLVVYSVTLLPSQLAQLLLCGTNKEKAHPQNPRWGSIVISGPVPWPSWRTIEITIS
jgi:hypothetical protein